jgi:peptidyl-prolyl cis-trans isomerase D
MLRGIRTASANWLGKLVMGLVVSVLALSFAIWGIGDIFKGFGRSSLASVGSTEISVEQFRQIYTERLQQIGQQMGRPIPADQARALGLDRQILGQLVSETALDEWARRIGLGITDDEVARIIRTFPAFRGPNGEFDHTLFLARLRNAGYTEPRFVAEQRRLMIRQHLNDSIGGVTVVPKLILDALNNYQNEQRTIEYIALTKAQAGDIPPPSPEELSSYFEKSKNSFRAPEYRRIVMLRLSPEDVAKWIQVTDAEARKYYDERKSTYTVPGRRHVQQIVFPTPEEARAAKEKIDAGTSFEEIAKARGLSEQDIDLGFVARAAFATAPAVAEAAFSLAEGAVSAPVQSRLGTALVRIVKIEPDTVQPFEELAETIKASLARDRARNELSSKHDKVEDERAGGTNLTDTAQKAGLTPTVFEAVDRAGRDQAGTPAPGLPTDIDVLTPAFSASVGFDADALRVGDGYVWFEVTNITPSKERTLDEVKERVEARWRDEQVGERLKKKADELVEKLKAGTPLADIATAENLTVQKAADLKRSGRAEGVSGATVNAAFRTAKGVYASAEGDSAAERIIFRVTDISVPDIDLNSAEGKRIDEALRSAFSEDFLRQYLGFIERELKVTINTEALRRIAGGEQ